MQLILRDSCRQTRVEAEPAGKAPFSRLFALFQRMKYWFAGSLFLCVDSREAWSRAATTQTQVMDTERKRLWKISASACERRAVSIPRALSCVMCLQEFRSSCLLSEPLAGELLSTSGLGYSKSEARWTHKSFFASLFKKTPQWVPHCTATCALSTNIIQNTPVLYSKLKASCQMIVIPYIYESVGKKIFC